MRVSNEDGMRRLSAYRPTMGWCHHAAFEGFSSLAADEAFDTADIT